MGDLAGRPGGGVRAAAVVLLLCTLAACSSGPTKVGAPAELDPSRPLRLGRSLPALSVAEITSSHLNAVPWSLYAVDRTTGRVELSYTWGACFGPVVGTQVTSAPGTVRIELFQPPAGHPPCTGNAGTSLVIVVVRSLKGVQIER